jgi:ribosomal protein S18 acetylase RimI-like enzyme
VPTTARELDLLGARAWPALEVLALDGWRLRFSGGVTKRANSVLPLGDGRPPSDAGLATRLDAVERAYAERGLPPRFQITASTWPPALTRALAGRRYVESASTLVLTSRGATAPPPERWDVVARSDPSPRWFATWWAVDGRGGDSEADTARATLASIGPERLFVECGDGEGTAAVALGVLDGGWVGIYCMATRPRMRRRKCARALLAHLTARAGRAHLSVVEGNVVALSLYRAAGFELQQRYSYFTLPAATA